MECSIPWLVPSAGGTDKPLRAKKWARHIRARDLLVRAQVASSFSAGRAAAIYRPIYQAHLRHLAALSAPLGFPSEKPLVQFEVVRAAWWGKCISRCRSSRRIRCAASARGFLAWL
jgi:hypothetical protein